MYACQSMLRQKNDMRELQSEDVMFGQGEKPLVEKKTKAGKQISKQTEKSLQE